MVFPHRYTVSRLSRPDPATFPPATAVLGKGSGRSPTLLSRSVVSSPSSLPRPTCVFIADIAVGATFPEMSSIPEIMSPPTGIQKSLNQFFYTCADYDNQGLLRRSRDF